MDLKIDYDKIIDRVLKEIKEKIEKEEYVDDSDGSSEILSQIIHELNEVGIVEFKELKECIDFIRPIVEEKLSEDFYQVCNYEEIENFGYYCHYYTLHLFEDFRVFEKKHLIKE